MNDSKQPIDMAADYLREQLPDTPVYAHGDERATVYCDEGCGAFREPVTLDEYRAALEHWMNHSQYAGCSHGR